MNSCDKGKRIEREAVKLLRSLGYDARRGQQHAGSPDSPDVVGVPGIHLEVKGRRDLTLGSAVLENAMRQAERDAGPSAVPVVLWMEYRKGWRLTWRDGVLQTVAGPDGIAWALNWLRGASPRQWPTSGETV